MDAQPQTGVELPEMLDWHLFPGDNRSFVLLEGEGDNRVETRLTVNWDERKIRPVSYTHLFVNANTIFIGLPLNIALFGNQALPYFLVYYITNTVSTWTLGVYLMTSDSKEGRCV